MIHNINFTRAHDGIICDHRFDFLIKTPDLFFKRLEYYLQQNNNFKFIKLTQTHEIFSVDNYKMISESTLCNFKKILDKYKIEAIILEDNNLNNSNKFHKNILHESHPFFLGMTSPYSFNISKRIFDKKFICLNSRKTPHRVDIIKFLYETLISDESILTHNFNVFGNSPNSINIMTELDSIKHNIYNTSCYKPMLLNYQTFCNIVTETFFYKKNITFITEKTEKCFSAGQPFIVVSTPKFLHELKNLGYKTFDQWWDESYDDEVDDFKRLEKIKDTIRYINNFSLEKLSEIYSEMIPVLHHNRRNNEKWYLINLAKRYG